MNGPEHFLFMIGLTVLFEGFEGLRDKDMDALKGVELTQTQCGASPISAH